MTTTDPTAGPQIVSGDYDEAAEALVADEAEDPRTRVAELEEVLVQWHDAAQTLRRQRDEALGRLRTLIDEVWRHIGQHDCGSYGACLARIRERADEMRADTHTGAQTGSQGPLDGCAHAAADSTGRLPRADAEAWAAENARLRSQLAEAREALAAAESERDAAREAQVQHATAMAAIDAEIIDDLRAVLGLSPGQSLTKAVTQLRDDLAWLRRQVLVVAADLERYASDLRPARLPMSERKLAWTLRQIVAGERPEAPETAPESPQTDEQTQVRGESHTDPQAGSQGPLDLDAIRAAWLRVCGPCDAGYPTACTCPTADPRAVIDALVAEIDRLRTEAAMLRAEREWLADRARTMGIAEAIIAAHGPAHAVSAEAGRLRTERDALRARVREWEAVHADLAKRCDSGDIPIRLGERYSQAVLREIDRLRAERDRLRRRLGDVLDLEELPEDHTIVAAVRRLRAALGSTPDTGSTT